MPRNQQLVASLGEASTSYRRDESLPGSEEAARMTGRGRVAILIPAYNEEAVLDRTLSAAVREVGAENVYVANDCSTDLTAHIGRFWTGNEADNNVYTAPENGGKSRTLKATIDHFVLTERYEAIFILDADTWLAPGHVAALEREMKPGVAFVVGRIESRLEFMSFWPAYRHFSMWMYNSTIRTPQNVLNTINVLPGSSVLLASEAVERIDWERASKLRLDDFSMLCDIRYEGLGEIKYIHETPPAVISEPLTFGSYFKQTYGRWWPGIWQTMRDRGMWRRLDWFSVTNNLHVLNWIWSAITPVFLILLYVALNGTLWAWSVPVMIAWYVGQMYIFAILYAYHKKRPSALVLLPAFVAVGYLEAVLFGLAYFKSRRLTEGGRWESPSRTKVSMPRPVIAEPVSSE